MMNESQQGAMEVEEALARRIFGTPDNKILSQRVRQILPFLKKAIVEHKQCKYAFLLKKYCPIESPKQVRIEKQLGKVSWLTH
jgi:hypothetical protein